MLSLVDTHVHLDQDEFAEDRDEVIRRAVEAGVAKMLTVGIGAESSQQSINLAAAHDVVFAAVGIQPNYCAQAEPGDWDRIVRLAQQLKVVALGETGLDRHWDYSPFDLQQDYFDRHLRLSQSSGLPFIVHTRESEEDVIAMLREARKQGPLSGVMHSFVGDASTADACLEMGLYISFAGMVTYKKSDLLRRVAATIPDDRILVETDAPYLSPHPRRGQRNEPAHVVHTARLLAEVRQQNFEEFARQTTQNACRLFGF